MAEIDITDERLINEARSYECIEDGLYFSRYFFKQQMGTKMLRAPFHNVLQDTMDRTMLPPDDPEFISRLIINIPPGYGKTQQAVINYIARGLAISPDNRYLHLSYSHALALKNSADVRRLTKSDAFQAMWPVRTKEDTDSKSMWWTEENGGLYATSTASQVTGFRAGHMNDSRFTGALVIDDPLKPDDAHSQVIKSSVNNSFNETIASRVAVETVPIIVIMQRLDWNDLTGYLLRGGSGEMWHHLNLPVIIDNSEKYPEENTHGIPIEHGLPDGWLWPYKHNEKHEVALKSHRRKYAAQYKQKPLKRDEFTQLWTEALINKARTKNIIDDAIRTVVAVDPATTNTEASDEHGIIVGSEYPGKEYSLDADYSRKGSPLEWAQAAIHAYEYHDADAIIIETNQGGDMVEDTLTNAGYTGRIIRVHAKKGKTLRAEPVVGLYELGKVQHKPGLGEAEDEMEDFDPVTQKSNGHSPNRVDASVYVLSELSGVGLELDDLLKMAMGE